MRSARGGMPYYRTVQPRRGPPEPTFERNKVPAAPAAQGAGGILHHLMVAALNIVDDRKRLPAAKEFAQGMEDRVEETLRRTGEQGVLIEVQVRKYQDTGVAAVHNDLIHWVGEGFDPSDALANDMTSPKTTLSQGAAKGTVYDWDRSFFIWMERKEQTLTVEVIHTPKALYRAARRQVRSGVGEQVRRRTERVEEIQAMRAKIEAQPKWNEKFYDSGTVELSRLATLYEIKTAALDEAERRLARAKRAREKARKQADIAAFLEWGEQSLDVLSNVLGQAAQVKATQQQTKEMANRLDKIAAQRAEEVDVLRKSAVIIKNQINIKLETIEHNRRRGRHVLP